MSRFPAIPENDLNLAQKGVKEGAGDVFSRLPDHLIWKTEDGSLMGPYQPLFYTTDVSQQWFDLAFAVTRQKRFSLREKELCIIAVLSEYNAPYPRYAHLEIGLGIGFSKDQVQDAFDGQSPTGLSERESATYDLALALTKLRAPMGDRTFEAAREMLDRDEVAGVAHIVSGYIYVAMLSNLANVQVPKEKKGGS